MAFLLPALEGLGSGLLGSAVGGALGSGTAGNAENAAMNAINSQDESFQLSMYASEIQHHQQDCFTWNARRGRTRSAAARRQLIKGDRPYADPLLSTVT